MDLLCTVVTLLGSLVPVEGKVTRIQYKVINVFILWWNISQLTGVLHSKMTPCTGHKGPTEWLDESEKGLNHMVSPSLWAEVLDSTSSKRPKKKWWIIVSHSTSRVKDTWCQVMLKLFWQHVWLTHLTVTLSVKYSFNFTPVHDCLKRTPLNCNSDFAF